MESELIKPSLGIFGLLKESFKTVKRNRKLLFPVLVFVFLCFSQLEFAENFFLQSVAEDLSLQLAENPKLLQDLGDNTRQNDHNRAFKAIREVLLVKLLTLIMSSIISIVFLVATVSSSSEAYTSKVIDLKEMILKVKKSWKKPMLTSFYMILILMGLVFVTFFSVGILSIMAKDSTWVYLFYGVPILLIIVVGSYLSALWMMSLVVSILEDVGGLNANVRAIELMKGKKVQVSFIMVFFALAYWLIYPMTNAITSHGLNKWTRLAISIPLANGLDCALKLFMFVIFTVFYHKQKEIYDENEAKGVYVPIVVGEV